MRIFFIGFYLFISSLFLVFISTNVIDNPDLDAYLTLLTTSTGFSLSIEPTIYLFSTISRFFSEIFFIDPIYIFYFQYIFLIQFFLILGFLKYTYGSLCKSLLILFAWFLTYGTLHSLVQIRFGLANAMIIYLFSLSLSKKINFNFYLISVMAFFTHYSSVLAVACVNIINVKKSIFKIPISLFIHIVFIFFLLLFKFGHIFSFLPDFLMARLFGYLSDGDSANASGGISSVIMSFFLYVILMLTPKIKDNISNNLRVYGALGFLPYFLVPNLEILVRLGIAFQYLLLPYLFLTFNLKKVLLFSTVPLIFFYIYKIYSNFNIFINYL